MARLDYQIYSAPLFTRPSDTTQYAAADLLANSTTAGSVVALVFSTPSVPFRVVSARVVKSATSITSFTPTLYLYSSAPTFGAGDNSAPAPSNAGLLGVLPMANALAGTSHAVAWSTSTTTAFPVYGGGTVYGFIVPGGTYTPASAETFTVSITAETYY